MLFGSLLALLGTAEALDELWKLNTVLFPTPSLQQAGNSNKTGFIMWPSYFNKQKAVVIAVRRVLVLSIIQNVKASIF